jgi:mannitol/fructose-specific phosphotransferase system IIA component (Ntr-type)
MVVAVGKPALPMEFESADGRPCRMIVLIAGPRESSGPHLQALAAISRLWLNRNFREAAIEAATADELFDVFSKFDA